MPKTRNHTGGRFQLDVGGHNVGFLRTFDGLNSGAPEVLPVPGPASWRAGTPLEPFVGMAEFAAAARRRHPAGLNGILIGLHPLPRQQPVAGKDTVGVLIGLLLPAVQRLMAPASSELVLLAGALRQGGWIGFRGADGSFQPLGKGAPPLPSCLQG